MLTFTIHDVGEFKHPSDTCKTRTNTHHQNLGLDVISDQILFKVGERGVALHVWTWLAKASTAGAKGASFCLCVSALSAVEQVCRVRNDAQSTTVVHSSTINFCEVVPQVCVP